MNNISNIDVFTLSKWLASSPILLIDVREQTEYSSGHIIGSINIPLSTLMHEITHLDIHNQKTVILCRVGARSMIACLRLQEEGYAIDLHNLSGGINKWQEEGLVISKKRDIY